MKINSLQIKLRSFSFESEMINPAVSHIQDFGDAAASSVGDAASPAGDAATRVGDVHLPA